MLAHVRQRVPDGGRAVLRPTSYTPKEPRLQGGQDSKMRPIILRVRSWLRSLKVKLCILAAASPRGEGGSRCPSSPPLIHSSHSVAQQEAGCDLRACTKNWGPSYGTSWKKQFFPKCRVLQKKEPWPCCLDNGPPGFVRTTIRLRSSARDGTRGR